MRKFLLKCTQSIDICNSMILLKTRPSALSMVTNVGSSITTEQGVSKNLFPVIKNMFSVHLKTTNEGVKTFSYFYQSHMITQTVCIQAEICTQCVCI